MGPHGCQARVEWFFTPPAARGLQLATRAIWSTLEFGEVQTRPPSPLLSWASFPWCGTEDGRRRWGDHLGTSVSKWLLNIVWERGMGGELHTPLAHSTYSLCSILTPLLALSPLSLPPKCCMFLRAQLEQASHPQCCSVDQRLHAARALLGLGAWPPLADEQTLALA